MAGDNVYFKVCFGVVLVIATGRISLAEQLEKTTERGPVEVTVRLSPAEPVIGDTLTLTIEAVAQPDVELLMPEFGEALDRYRIVDFAPRQTLDDAGRTVATQTYRLDTSRSGQQSIPPILIEFVDRRPGQQQAPDDLDAYEILTERLDFWVQSVLPDEADADLKPPLGRLDPLPSGRASTFGWIALVVLAVAAAVVGAVYFNKVRRIQRRRSAFEIARQRLERLLRAPRPHGEQVDAFYVELSGIVRQYLEDRFDLRAPELTTEEFLVTVGESAALTPGHQTLLREFLSQADLVKFAGLQPADDDIKRSLSAAERFLNETRDDVADDQTTHSAAPA